MDENSSERVETKRWEVLFRSETKGNFVRAQRGFNMSHRVLKQHSLR